MIKNEKLYNILKYITMIVLPALTALWITLGNTWGFPYIHEIATTLAAVTTFMGAVLCIDSKLYAIDKEKEGGNVEDNND